MDRKQRTASATATATANTETIGGERDEEHSVRTASTASENEITTTVHNLRFSLIEGIAYHAIRERFLSRFNRFFIAVQVFLGTGAIASMTNYLSWNPLWFLVISSLFGVILLVIDPAAGAREHRSLRSRLHMLLAELEETDPTESEFRRIRASRERVAADAPPAFKAIQAIAYNTAVNATYAEEYAAAHRYRVGWWRNLTGNIRYMSNAQFKKALPRKSEND